MKTLKYYYGEKAIKFIDKHPKLKAFYEELITDFENGSLNYSTSRCNLHKWTTNENYVVVDWTDHMDKMHQFTILGLESAIIAVYFIEKYNGKLKNQKYHWTSRVTGELQKNIFSVIKTVFSTKKHYGFWNLKWKYSRKGF